MFIGGNDILHVDVPSRKTTSGTPQDTDGMWHSNFLIAKKLYLDVLEHIDDHEQEEHMHQPLHPQRPRGMPFQPRHPPVNAIS